MRITKLTLTNFRNYAHCELAPEGRINLIVGENAQGKTNLLRPSCSAVTGARAGPAGKRT